MNAQLHISRMRCRFLIKRFVNDKGKRCNSFVANGEKLCWMHGTKEIKNQCKAKTLKGVRCRQIASIAGYCLPHFVGRKDLRSKWARKERGEM